jgi:hypothetical protein
MRYLVTLAYHGAASTLYGPDIEIDSATIVTGRDAARETVREIVARWGHSTPNAQMQQQAALADDLIGRWYGNEPITLLSYLYTLWVDLEPAGRPYVAGMERHAFHAARQADQRRDAEAAQRQAATTIAAEIRATNTAGQTEIADPDDYARRCVAAGVDIHSYRHAVQAVGGLTGGAGS